MVFACSSITFIWKDTEETHAPDCLQKELGG